MLVSLITVWFCGCAKIAKIPVTGVTRGQQLCRNRQKSADNCKRCKTAKRLSDRQKTAESGTTKNERKIFSKFATSPNNQGINPNGGNIGVTTTGFSTISITFSFVDFLLMVFESVYRGAGA